MLSASRNQAVSQHRKYFHIVLPKIFSIWDFQCMSKQGWDGENWVYVNLGNLWNIFRKFDSFSIFILSPSEVVIRHWIIQGSLFLDWNIFKNWLTDLRLLSHRSRGVYLGIVRVRITEFRGWPNPQSPGPSTDSTWPEKDHDIGVKRRVRWEVLDIVSPPPPVLPPEIVHSSYRKYDQVSSSQLSMSDRNTKL